MTHLLSSSQLGPDLSQRMSRRRRLPHPSSTTSSRVLQNGHPTQSQEPVTYSKFLGALEFHDHSVNGHAHPHAPETSFPSQRNHLYNSYDLSQPGPTSRINGRSHPSSHSTGEFVIESGWAQDIFGQQIYVGHGKIEEVKSDEAMTTNFEADDGDIYATPRASRAALATLNTQQQANIPFFDEPVPLISTPPPCPKPRNLPSLRATSTPSQYSFKATTTTSVAMAAQPHGSTYPAPDGPTEVALVKENITLLTSCQGDVQFMNTYFLAHIAEEDLSEHLETCTSIEESIKSLKVTLNLRSQIGAEEWHVRSSSWHQKYGKRLLSLRTTLQRLARVRSLIENRPLRPRQRAAILTKLEQHEAKLADLASKYTIAFDRLRLRHVHFLLTQSYNEAQRQKQSRLVSRPSFERRWREGKTIRAGLRSAFHELQQDFYQKNQRSNRPTSSRP